MEKYKSIVIGILLLLLFFSLRGCYTATEKYKEESDLVESLNAEIVTWKDKDSLNHAKIQVIETENVNSFLALNSKDSIIIKLQQEVEKYKKRLKNSGGSVTIIEGETRFDTITKFVSISDDCVFSEHIKNPWIDAKIGSTSGDSLYFNLGVTNKYTVVIGEEKVSFFKKKPFVEVTNYNPYSTTKTLRTYQVSQAKKHFGVGPQLGIGVTSDFQIRPYFGIGIHYSLIKF